MALTQRKGGRPSSYRPEACQVAERGATQPEIATELGVTNRTLSRWALKYPEFRAALDRGLARRAAELRWAETAPLRAAASELRRMIAEARKLTEAEKGGLEDNSSDASTRDGSLTSTNPIKSCQSLARARRKGYTIWHNPTEAEPDPTSGEPVELLDPRLGW